MSEEAAAEVRPPTPWIVWLIVGAIGVAYAAWLTLTPAMRDTLTYAFALIPERYHADSPDHFANWLDALAPIFGHTLLHVAWWHAAINAFFIFGFGRVPAMRLGPWRFLALYLISAVGSAIAYLAINWNSQNLAVGASGALCGVVSAYYLSARPNWRDALRDPLVRNQYAMMFFLNVVLMAGVSLMGWLPVAWEAHMGGFIAGALAWIVLAPKRDAYP